jgi:glutamate 5-kinase
MDKNRKNFLSKTRRIVIKIGTNVLSEKGTPDEKRIEKIVNNISSLIKSGREVIIVSSGAVGFGAGLIMQKGMTPETITLKQACASLGQPVLMQYYTKYFALQGFNAGQILLTNDIIKRSVAYKNARNTMLTLIEKNCVPIVNENDTVSVNELKFGDNDRLAAIVSIVTGADLCVLLSDIDGFYTDFKDKNKRQKLDTVSVIDEKLKKEAGVNTSGYSTGGMKSKIEAAKLLLASGISMAIINGKSENDFTDFFNGENTGTVFKSEEKTLTSKKNWLSFFANTCGKIEVDEGAYKALLKNGKSLLPSGIKYVTGDFPSGSVVEIAWENKVFAKGISWYSSFDLERIKGAKSSDILGILGYKDYDEVIHRDNLVLTD